MNDTTSTTRERLFESTRGWLATLIKRVPRFELMPDEKIIYQGFVVRPIPTWFGAYGKVYDGYLTSHRMVVCRIGVPFYRRSKRIAFELPLADVLKFEKLNVPGISSSSLNSRFYRFELQDGRRYVLSFRGNFGLTTFSDQEDRWVAAIEAALKSVQKD